MVSNSSTPVLSWRSFGLSVSLLLLVAIYAQLIGNKRESPVLQALVVIAPVAVSTATAPAQTLVTNEPHVQSGHFRGRRNRMLNNPQHSIPDPHHARGQQTSLAKGTFPLPIDSDRNNDVDHAAKAKNVSRRSVWLAGGLRKFASIRRCDPTRWPTVILNDCSTVLNFSQWRQHQPLVETFDVVQATLQKLQYVYWLMEGTVLNAIRHGAIITDDDIDFGIQIKNVQEWSHRYSSKSSFVNQIRSTLQEQCQIQRTSASFRYFKWRQNIQVLEGKIGNIHFHLHAYFVLPNGSWEYMDQATFHFLNYILPPRPCLLYGRKTFCPNDPVRHLLEYGTGEYGDTCLVVPKRCRTQLPSKLSSLLHTCFLLARCHMDSAGWMVLRDGMVTLERCGYGSMTPILRRLEFPSQPPDLARCLNAQEQMYMPPPNLRMLEQLDGDAASKTEIPSAQSR